MSYIRTAAYSSARVSTCRSLGRHGWDGDRCTTCGLIRDDHDKPYRPALRIGVDSPHGGVTVGNMEAPPPVRTMYDGVAIGPKDHGAFRATMGIVRSNKPQ